MKTINYTHINEVAAGKISSALSVLLADFQVFYTNLRGFHWNVKGHAFFQLHSKFEELYDDTAEKIDEIAERILMLDGTPESKFSEYLKISNIKESGYVSCGKVALQNVLDSLGVLIAEERKIIALANENGDDTTAALLGDYLKAQEKLVWMLVAWFSGECSK